MNVARAGLDLLRTGRRSVRRRLPDRYVHLWVNIRELMLAPPWSYDVAAVELFRAEREARGELDYPNYLYGLLAAARTAMAVGSSSFSALEFGVAGGNGLRAMERHAQYIEQRLPLTISVFGLDSGAGLLPPQDPRDCAFALPPGEFAMDETRLRRELTRAELVLGPVEETVGPFVERAVAGAIPPIGFVAHDLDVYTGTAATLEAFTAATSAFLPRVSMYFDDLTGYPYTNEVGEWAAIRHFNEKSEQRKVGQMVNLGQSLGGLARLQNWPQHFFQLHVFDHPDYNAPEQARMYDLGLR